MDEIQDWKADDIKVSTGSESTYQDPFAEPAQEVSHETQQAIETTQAAPIQQTAPSEQNDTSSSFDINRFVAEKTGGKYGSFEDLTGELERLRQAPPPPKFKDETIAAAVAYYEKNGDLAGFVREYNTDYKSMSDLDVMRKAYRDQYPTLSDKAFDAVFRESVIDKFKLDADTYTEDQIAIGQELLKIEAERKRNEYIQKQEELKSLRPQEQAPEQSNTDEWKQTIQSNETTQKLLNDKRLEFEFNGEKYGWDVDPNRLVEMIEDPTKFWGNALTPDGQVDFQKAYKIANYAANIEAFEKSMIAFGKTLGREEMMNEIKNPAPPGGAAPARSGEDDIFSPVAAGNFRFS